MPPTNNIVKLSGSPEMPSDNRYIKLNTLNKTEVIYRFPSFTLIYEESLELIPKLRLIVRYESLNNRYL